MSIQRAFECESKVAQIITQQTINGVNFDAHKAQGYISELGQRKGDLYAQIRPHLDLEVIQPYTVPINEPYLRDGSYRGTVYDWYFYSGVIPDIGGPFTRLCFAEPDLGSRKKLISQLIRLGWKPAAFTEKGNPKLTVEGEPCPSLMEIGSEIGKQIAHWYIYNHRQSQIQGWLNKLRPDGKLEARGITIGTPTFRFRHSIVVNVPKAADYVLFGKEMRSLFIADEGDVLVGHDARGLELRMLAHYINDTEYTKVVSEGDPHTHHQTLAKLDTRDQAKEFIYSFNYGAGSLLIGIGIKSDVNQLNQTYEAQIPKAMSKLAKRANKSGMVDIGKKTFVPLSPEMALRYLDGEAIKKRFLSYNPKLKALISDVQEAAKRGYLRGLDGRHVLLRRDSRTNAVQVHKSFNTLLQCAGALVMKYAMVNLDNWIREMGLGSKKCIDMHDESQYSVPPQDTELHAILARYSIIEAGRQLNLRIPLDADVKIGASWANTH